MIQLINLSESFSLFYSLRNWFTCLRRLQERVKMSKSEESLNDDAIFLCLVRGCVVSAWKRKHTMLNSFNTTHTEGNEGKRRKTNPPDWSHWSAGTRWWPLWCSVQRCPVNAAVTRHQHDARHIHLLPVSHQMIKHTPVGSASHRRWRFWRRSHLSDSRTSPVWWFWRTAGSTPGSRMLLTLAA